MIIQNHTFRIVWNVEYESVLMACCEETIFNTSFRSNTSSRYCGSDGRQSVGSGQFAIPIPTSGILCTILGLLDESRLKPQG